MKELEEVVKHYKSLPDFKFMSIVEGADEVRQDIIPVLEEELENRNLTKELEVLQEKKEIIRRKQSLKKEGFSNRKISKLINEEYSKKEVIVNSEVHSKGVRYKWIARLLYVLSFITFACTISVFVDEMYLSIFIMPISLFSTAVYIMNRGEESRKRSKKAV